MQILFGDVRTVRLLYSHLRFLYSHHFVADWSFEQLCRDRSELMNSGCAEIWFSLSVQPLEILYSNAKSVGSFSSIVLATEARFQLGSVFCSRHNEVIRVYTDKTEKVVNARKVFQNLSFQFLLLRKKEFSPSWR